MSRIKALLLDISAPPSWAEMLSCILGGLKTPAVFEIVSKIVSVSDLSAVDTEVEDAVAGNSPDVLFLLLGSSASAGGRILAWLEKHGFAGPVLVVGGLSEPEEIQELLSLGATDLIIPPLKASTVLPSLLQLIPRILGKQQYSDEPRQDLILKRLLGQNDIFQAEVWKLPQIARCDASVLISGETGTGKELFAHAIHYLSPRSSKPFVPVTCGAVPDDLIENELFGHHLGAFTGAVSNQEGLIQEAEGGTLFLDDIDCLGLALQPKLLRFLQTKEYRILGSSRLRTGNVRIIAATNIDLRAAVNDGRFRADLYYRLNVLPIGLPPLRQRPEDIPILTRHFLRKFAAKYKTPVRNLSIGAIQSLLLHDWPGNVRELEHLMERIAVLGPRGTLGPADLGLSSLMISGPDVSFRQAKAKAVAEFEKAYIERLLMLYCGNISQAAKAAHKNRRAFWELVRKHSISAGHFKAPTSNRQEPLIASPANQSRTASVISR